MPKKPMQPCKHSRCPNLTQDIYCSEYRKLHVADRPNAVKRGCNSKWRSARNKSIKRYVQFRLLMQVMSS
ncbi:hypothetical protein FDB28_03820 [Clostridium botulinum]|nr:hypothetical protein [Clostridium botulinum]NFS97574.1 hypothetical protein [Clostridium botulinum]